MIFCLFFKGLFDWITEQNFVEGKNVSVRMNDSWLVTKTIMTEVKTVIFFLFFLQLDVKIVVIVSSFFFSYHHKHYRPLKLTIILSTKKQSTKNSLLFLVYLFENTVNFVTISKTEINSYVLKAQKQWQFMIAIYRLRTALYIVSLISRSKQQ